MRLTSLRSVLLCIGSLILVVDDLIEVITAISEVDPVPLLIHALALAITKYQSTLKSKTLTPLLPRPLI